MLNVRIKLKILCTLHPRKSYQEGLTSDYDCDVCRAIFIYLDTLYNAEEALAEAKRLGARVDALPTKGGKKDEQGTCGPGKPGQKEKENGD